VLLALTRALECFGGLQPPLHIQQIPELVHRRGSSARRQPGQPPLEQEPDQRNPLELAELGSVQSWIGERGGCQSLDLRRPAQDPLDPSPEADIPEDRSGDPPHRHSFGGKPLNLGPLGWRRFRSLA